MNTKFCWRILAILFLIAGQILTTKSASALGTPQIVGVDPWGSAEIGTTVTIHASVVWDSDFRSMRICFGDWCQEEATPDFSKNFDTWDLPAKKYQIYAQVAKVGEDWETSTISNVVDFVLTTPEPSLQDQGVDSGANAEFWSDLEYLTQGDCTYLHWRTTNATTVKIDDSPVALSGEMQICPTITTDYKLVAEGHWSGSGKIVTIVVTSQIPVTQTPQVRSTSVPSQPETQNKTIVKTCFAGQDTGWRDGHHYVWFQVNFVANDWVIEDPWWVPNAQLWAFPDGSGYAEGGFSWPDWFPVIFPASVFKICGTPSQ